MHFKYYDRPERFTGFLEEKTECDCCGEVRECFDGEAFFGADAIAAICPECLAKGKLYELDTYSCEGDTETLQNQLTQLNPGLSKKEIEALVQSKTEELQKTTPPLISWQDWLWPCAEGDYCRFIGYGSKALYLHLAGDKKGKTLFGKSLQTEDPDEMDADYYWDDYLPDRDIPDYEASSEYGTLFYVFQSLHSATLITLIDSH